MNERISSANKLHCKMRILHYIKERDIIIRTRKNERK